MKYSQPSPLGFGGKRFRARMPEAGPLEAMFIEGCVWAISPWRRNFWGIQWAVDREVIRHILT